MSRLVEIEFGEAALSIRVPDRTDVLTLPEVGPLGDPAADIRAGLRNPIGTPPLDEIVRARRAERPDARAVIVVSDNTRPVPYKGPEGILEPIVERLRSAGVTDIGILIAAGTHRLLDDAELRVLLPESVFDGHICITSHVCTDAASLRRIGTTRRGTDVRINAAYLDADIKILTGLVEPHFMAGFSGGRKSVCPGLIGEEGTFIFHGPELMADPRSDSLVTQGNPCHEESLEVARMAGVDFIVNVTLDGALRVTGVFCGDLEAAHEAAMAKAIQTNAVRIEREYDLAVTHAGFAGINHYQAVKAAVEASKVVKTGGAIILAANNTDKHPVGGEGYRQVLPLLMTEGPGGVTRRLLAPDWDFIPEQWEVQMWARAFNKLGAMDRLVYCAPQLTGAAFKAFDLPGVDGGAGLAGPARSGPALAEAMVQHSLDRLLAESPGSSVAVLADGPYGVPVRPDPA